MVLLGYTAHDEMTCQSRDSNPHQAVELYRDPGPYEEHSTVLSATVK